MDRNINIEEIWQEYFKSHSEKLFKELVTYYYPTAIEYTRKATCIFKDILNQQDVEADAGYELMKAIKIFNPQQDPNFTRYLRKRIKWLVLAKLREADHLSPFERMLIKKYNQIKSCGFPYKPKDVTDDEICEKLGITLEKLDQIRIKNQFPGFSMNSMKPEQVDNILSEIAINTHIPTPPDIAERKDMVKKILSMLPERYRMIFIMRYLHGLSLSEIATALGMGVKGIESILRRYKKKLHEYFVKDKSKPITESEMKIFFDPKSKIIEKLLKKVKKD